MQAPRLYLSISMALRVMLLATWNSVNVLVLIWSLDAVGDGSGVCTLTVDALGQAQLSPPCRALAARLAPAPALSLDSPASAAKARAARTHAPGAFADVTNVGGSAARARLRAQKAIVA